jgi:hypothetical protein
MSLPMGKSILAEAGYGFGMLSRSMMQMSVQNILSIFRKKCKKVQKLFDLYFYKNKFELGKFYYQMISAKKLYKP